jgi:hypothetical protein
MENTDGGKWGQNIALYIIAGVIVIALFMWFVHQTGKEKADLSASVQNLYGRIAAIEPAVAANTATLGKVGNTLSAAVQGVADIKADVDALDGAVFAPVFSHGRRGGCGCGGSEKFRKESTYTLDTTTLTEIDTCNN